MEDNGLFYLTEKEYPALYDEIYRQTHKLTEKICRECPDILEDGMLRHAQLYTSGVLYAYGVMEPVIYNDVKGMAGFVIGLLPETGLEAEVRCIERLEGPYAGGTGYMDAAMFWHGFATNGGMSVHGTDLRKASSFFLILYRN